MNNRWFYLAVAIVLAAVWMMRWGIYEQQGGNSPGTSYLLDRWTGQVRVMYGEESAPVKELKEN